MAKNLGDEFQDIQAFINQLEGARLIDEAGKPYTLTHIRGPPMPWSGDDKRIIYTAKYDDGTEVNVVTLGDAYFHKHRFVKPIPEDRALVDGVVFPETFGPQPIPGVKDAWPKGPHKRGGPEDHSYKKTLAEEIANGDA